MITWLLLVAALTVAFANGANDNFKGVATLYGSGVLSYRASLAVATVTVAAGGLLSVILASALAQSFSGKGLVPPEALSPGFMASVAAGAALTVLAATWLGMPVSTTHALVGGLVGAGFMAAGIGLNIGALGAAFLLPLLLGPMMAVPLAAAGWFVGHRGRKRLGIDAETCICVGEEWVPVRVPSAAPAHRFTDERLSVGPGLLTTGMDTAARCERRYSGRMVGISVQAAVSWTHVASACVVGFARGLNDTPKILGLLLGAAVIAPVPGTLLVTTAMILGGLVASARVAETLSRKVTDINPGQGLAGNLTTSVLVLGASGFGLPVSTTHVSTGSIFGIGAARGRLGWRMVNCILLAWITTVPVAAILAGVFMWALR